ncbi:MAG: type II toxin-antitoxin system VapC family toxin [Anaerolineales bacterium]
MTPKYLLDTNILSEPLRSTPNTRIVNRLKRYRDELATAAVVWHELWFGCRRLPASAKREAIERYLDEVIAVSVVILPYDEKAAEWHAAERARLVADGRTPTFVDGQIAAIAAINGLTLVTLNRADYRNYHGLELEDWSS